MAYGATEQPEVIGPYRKPRDGTALSDWREHLNATHRKVRARAEHALARIRRKTWKRLRQVQQRPSECTPNCLATRATAPRQAPVSVRICKTIRAPRSINSSGRFLGAGMALIPFQGSEPPPDPGRFTDSISRIWICYVTYPCQKGHSAYDERRIPNASSVVLGKVFVVLLGDGRRGCGCLGLRRTGIRPSKAGPGTKLPALRRGWSSLIRLERGE
jgi:hypothetical protein